MNWLSRLFQKPVKYHPLYQHWLVENQRIANQNAEIARIRFRSNLANINSHCRIGKITLKVDIR